MFGMAEPNWHKQVAIGTWILLAVTIGLGILQYLRPPDPAHPMKFDFLTQSLSIPPWLLVIAPVAIILLTIFATRQWISNNKILWWNDQIATLNGRDADSMAAI